MEHTVTVEARLNALERANRRLRLWLRAIVGVVILLAAGGWAERERILSVDSVETNQLSITDSKGNARIRMMTGKDDDLALIRMFGADTNVSLITIGNSARRGASSLTFSDSKGRRRLALTVEQDTNVLINIFNPRGKVSAALVSRGAASAVYSSALIAIDSAGNSRIMAGSTQEEKYEPFLYFYDESGKQRAAVNIRENGVGILKFNDEAGRAAAAIGTQPKSRGFAVTLDTAGKSLWGSP